MWSCPSFLTCARTRGGDPPEGVSRDRAGGSGPQVAVSSRGLSAPPPHPGRARGYGRTSTRARATGTLRADAPGPPVGGPGRSDVCRCPATASALGGLRSPGLGQLHRRRGEALDRPEDDDVLVGLRVDLGVDHDDLAGPDLLQEELLRDRVLDQALDRPAER